MKKLVVVLSALSWLGCFDFNADLATCHQSGGCARDGGEEARDSGLTDAGESDAGLDAGTDAGTDGGAPLVTSPVFFTSTGWGWEFPFPAGPGLHSVAALGADEAWAAGDDDSLLHYLDGGLTYSRVVTPAQGTLRGGQVLTLSDGGVLLADGTGLFTRGPSSWTRSAFPLIGAVAELGLDGTPWFGGQWQQTATGPCSPAGSAVVEGSPVGAPLCILDAGSMGYVVGLDSHGWGLDSSGKVLRRQVLADGGVGWPVVANHSTGYFPLGDVLPLSADQVLLVGLNAGSSAVVSLDGGIEPVTFDPLGLPEEWTSLLRDPDQQHFFVTGKPGVYRCVLAVPLVVGQCVLELTDDSATLEALAEAQGTFFGVGDNGQLIRRDADAGWSTLLPGGVGTVHDVWADPNGELWAVANGGWLLHRSASGWERLHVSNNNLLSITRTSDGLLWIGGDEVLGSFDPANVSLTAATLHRPTGALFTLGGTGYALSSLSGTAPGNTWAAGDRLLLRYLDGEWTESEFVADAGRSISDLWASEAGTAWAVGGYNSRLVLFWDGTRWQNRTPPGTSEFYAVWGPSGAHAFVSGEQDSHQFLSDGGVISWDLNWATSLSGALTADGGYLVFGGRGTQVWRAPRGNPPPSGVDTKAPRDGYMTRLRVIGPKVFVMGDRDLPRSFLLSFDAGL